MLICVNIKNIVALKIDGVKDAMNEKNIKHTLVITNDFNSLIFNLFNIYIINDESNETCSPDKANKCVIPFIL